MAASVGSPIVRSAQTTEEIAYKIVKMIENAWNYDWNYHFASFLPEKTLKSFKERYIADLTDALVSEMTKEELRQISKSLFSGVALKVRSLYANLRQHKNLVEELIAFEGQDVDLPGEFNECHKMDLIKEYLGFHYSEGCLNLSDYDPEEIKDEFIKHLEEELSVEELQGLVDYYKVPEVGKFDSIIKRINESTEESFFAAMTPVFGNLQKWKAKHLENVGVMGGAQFEQMIENPTIFPSFPPWLCVRSRKLY